jgi:hypothetical protein
MFPQNDELYRALIKERQDEIRRAVARYHLDRAARAAQPPRPPRLAGLLQCLRRWSTGVRRGHGPLPPIARSAGSPDRRSAAATRREQPRMHGHTNHTVSGDGVYSLDAESSHEIE